MRRKGLMHLPVIDQSQRLVGLRTAQDLLIKEQRLNPVLLMAGGLGKRLRPLTKNTPKPLLKVGQNPILQTTLEKLIDDGFFHFFISVNYLGEQVREFFGDGSQWGIQIEYLQESEPLGTAGAISLLDKTRITEPLLVMNGDLLTKVNFGELLDFHNLHHSMATLCVREHEFKIPYGVVSGFESEMSRIEEKPAKKVFVNAGIYVLESKLLDGPIFSGPCDMPTVLNQIVDEGEKVTMFPIHEYWIDVGNIQDFERAQFDVND
jgi:NDP-sugar pyrophosphorylase family protein